MSLFVRVRCGEIPTPLGSVTPRPGHLAVLLGPAEENTRYHYYVLSVGRRPDGPCRSIASSLGHCYFWVRITEFYGFTSARRASEYLFFLSSTIGIDIFFFFFFFFRPRPPPLFAIWRRSWHPHFIHLDRLCYGIFDIGNLYFLFGGAGHVRYDAACCWESKELCYSLLTDFRVV